MGFKVGLECGNGVHISNIWGEGIPEVRGRRMAESSWPHSAVLFGLQYPLFPIAESKYLLQGSILVYFMFYVIVGEAFAESSSYNASRCKLVERLFPAKAFPTKKNAGVNVVNHIW